MKLSSINWLSRSIVLPLFIITANIALANAEQIAPSLRLESLPSVKNLNFSIPVPTKSIDSTDGQESMSVTPYWSNSRASNGSTKVVKQRNNKSQPISRAKRKFATNSIETTKIQVERSSLPKSVLKFYKVLAVNT